MVGKIVVTYKRKRLSSRSGRSHDVSSDQHENSIADTRLQDLDKEHVVCHEHINNSEGGSNHTQSKELSEDKGSSTCSTLTLKQGDNLDKDHRTNFRDDPSYKQRLSLPLITFTRRSKRQRDTDAHAPMVASELAHPATSCVDLKDKCALNPPSFFIGNQEKNSSDDIESSLLSGPDVATSRIIGTGNLSQSLHGKAKEARSVSAQIIQGCHVVTSSVEADINQSDVSSVTKGTHSNVLASGGIDCNLPPESDENTPMIDVEDASGSTSMVNEKSPSLPLQEAENRSSTRPFVDKGKSVMDSPQVTCLELFPLSRSDETLQTTTNDPQNRFPNLSLQFNGNNAPPGSSSSLYMWPDVPVRSREPLRDFLPYISEQSIQRKILHDMLPKRGTASSSSFLDRFAHPYSTWSEDELDCLWIGVRRHGLGNWDAILRDRRLRFFFLPWRTASDLAERWLEEQSQLVQGLPASSRLKSAVYSGIALDRSNQHPMRSHARNLVNEFQLSLGDSYRRFGYGLNNNNQRLSPSNFINDQTNSWNSVPYSYLGKEINSNPYDPSKAIPVKESLPHWLREANKIPSRLNDPNRYPQPRMSNGFGPTHYVNKSNMSVKAHPTNSPLVIRRAETKPDGLDLVVVSSDTSSEETVSDDRSVRP